VPQKGEVGSGATAGKHARSGYWLAVGVASVVLLASTNPTTGCCTA